MVRNVRRSDEDARVRMYIELQESRMIDIDLGTLDAIPEALSRRTAI